MKNSKLAIFLVLLAIATGTGSFLASATPQRPSLTPEYLATFEDSDYVVEFREEAGVCEVYDGATGEFLFSEDVRDMTREEAARAVSQRTRELAR